MTEADKLSQRAKAAVKRGDYVQGLDYVRNAVDRSPDNAAYHQTLGFILHKLGRESEAESSMRRSFQLDPETAEHWGELGMLLVDQKRDKDAAQCFEQCARLRPNDHAVFTYLAILQVSFDPHSALVNAEKALQLNSAYEEAQGIRDLARKRIAGESE